MIVCPACSRRFDGALEACPACGFAPPRIEGFAAWAPELAFGGGGFEAGYFASLAELEGGNFWFRARNDLVAWALRRHFPAMRSFLEVGCGTGFVLSGVARAFPEAALFGTEIFVAGLGFAAGRVPRARFMQMDARSIPFREEFDVIGAFDVIEHIEEDTRVLESIAGALRPGGGLVLTVPQHPRLWSAADDYARHVRRYTASEIHRKVADAGFELAASTSFVTLLLPLMAASRLHHREAADFDAQAELRIPKPLNSVLYAVLRAEIAAVRAGMRWPVGGTRLVVARKKA